MWPARDFLKQTSRSEGVDIKILGRFRGEAAERRQVKDKPNPFERMPEIRFVSDIARDEFRLRIQPRRFSPEVGRRFQIIKNCDFITSGQKKVRKVRADEAGTACH